MCVWLVVIDEGADEVDRSGMDFAIINRQQQRILKIDSIRMRFQLEFEFQHVVAAIYGFPPVSHGESSPARARSSIRSSDNNVKAPAIT